MVDGTPTGRFSYSADWDGVYETYAIKYRGTQMHGYVHAKDPSVINHQLARFLADVNEGNKRGAEADLMVTHPSLASVILENRRLNSLSKRELRDLGLSPRGYGGMLEFYSERLGDAQRLKDLTDPKRLALR